MRRPTVQCLIGPRRRSDRLLAAAAVCRTSTSATGSLWPSEAATCQSTTAGHFSPLVSTPGPADQWTGEAVFTNSPLDLSTNQDPRPPASHSLNPWISRCLPRLCRASRDDATFKRPRRNIMTNRVPIALPHLRWTHRHQVNCCHLSPCPRRPPENHQRNSQRDCRSRSGYERRASGAATGTGVTRRSAAAAPVTRTTASDANQDQRLHPVIRVHTMTIRAPDTAFVPLS